MQKLIMEAYVAYLQNAHAELRISAETCHSMRHTLQMSDHLSNKYDGVVLRWSCNTRTITLKIILLSKGNFQPG